MKKLITLGLFLIAAIGTTFGQRYQASPHLTYSNKSNFTIAGDSITGGTSICISLTNCHNVHITRCKLINTTNFGIYMDNCSNVLIDYNFINNVGTGVYANLCTGGIRVLYNQIKNIKRTLPYNHDYVQFNRVSGHLNRIMYNRGECIQGQSGPEDGINIYKSNGVAGDPITVAGNWLRGGGGNTGVAGSDGIGYSVTGSGITVGDQGGSFITVENNILVNTGYIGIQNAGGHDITIQNNYIYSDPFGNSHLGLGNGNYTSPLVTSYNIVIQNNHVKWTSGIASDNPHGGSQLKNFSFQAGTAQPTGWLTNVADNTLTTGILPTTLILMK